MVQWRAAVMTISVLPKTVRADHFRQSWRLVLVRPDKKELPVLVLGPFYAAWNGPTLPVLVRLWNMCLWKVGPKRAIVFLPILVHLALNVGLECACTFFVVQYSYVLSYVIIALQGELKCAKVFLWSSSYLVRVYVHKIAALQSRTEMYKSFSCLF